MFPEQDLSANSIAHLTQPFPLHKISNVKLQLFANANVNVNAGEKAKSSSSKIEKSNAAMSCFC